MKVVLDPSSIMNISFADLKENIVFYITESALNEIKDYLNKIKISKFKLYVLNPKEKTIKEIKEKLLNFVPLELLSDSDIELIALAKELNYVLFTEDFKIQNACYFLKIKFDNFRKKIIKYAYLYRKFCPNCKKFFENKYKKCKYCGEDLEIKIVKKFKV